MTLMNAFVELLGESNGDRFDPAKDSVQQRRAKVRIVKKVVGDAVDVPRDANRVDKAENSKSPPRQVRKREEESDEIGAMRQSGEHRNGVSPGVSEYLH